MNPNNCSYNLLCSNACGIEASKVKKSFSLCLPKHDVTFGNFTAFKNKVNIFPAKTNPCCKVETVQKTNLLKLKEE
jgi:hypothetical protein